MPAASELRQLKDEDLFKRLDEARHELFNLRFQHATNQLDNTARVGQVRKEIARLSTLIREREIAAAEGAN
jgi:large subunit ribosomal protein L29